MMASLDYSLGATASYVLSRRCATFYPSGASEAMMPGTMVSIPLTGDNFWLDPSTVYVQYTLRNANAAASNIHLRPGTDHAGCPFSRMRVLARGVVVEDIQFYHRVHTMFRRGASNYNDQFNEQIVGFGTALENPDAPDEYATCVVPPGQQLTVQFRPLLGLLNCGKLLPLRYLGQITLELYVASADEWLVDMGAGAVNIPGLDGNARIRTTGWSLAAFQLKCDVCTMDTRLEQDVAKKMLDNKALDFTFPSCFTQRIALPPNEDQPSFAITRALTRLKACYMTFARGESNGTLCWEFLYPFRNPDRPTFPAKVNRALSLQASIGSMLVPETALDSVAGFYNAYRLAMSNGMHADTQRATSHDVQSYQTKKFIAGIPFERVLGGVYKFSGLNTRSGDALTLRWKGLLDGQAAPPNAATASPVMFVTLVAQQLMQVTNAGVYVYE